jgi:hypothetical protein
MVRFNTVGIRYGALRKECLDAVRLWPGCETVAGIQIIRNNTPAGFSVRVTLYGKTDVKTADRAMVCVQREKRRQYRLIMRKSVETLQLEAPHHDSFKRTSGFIDDPSGVSSS